MKIEIHLNPKNPPIEIVVEESTAASFARGMAANETIRNLVMEAVKGEYFEAFPTYSDMDKGTARSLGQRYANEGLDGLNDLIVVEYASYPDSHSIRTGIDKALEEVYQALEDAAASQNVNLDGSIRDDFHEILEDDIATWLSEFDKSAPTDIIPSHADVEVAFVLGYGVLGIDDLQTRHFDHMSALDTVLPTANFLRFLKLINMAPSEYIAICAEEGRDPSIVTPTENMSDFRKEELERHALEWQAVLDVERGTNDFISKLPLRGNYEIAEWNSRVELIQSIKDYDRPASVSAKDLVNIVDNASYGGVATFAARLPLKDMVEGKFDKPFLAQGGFVGLHDFVNGSGYIETPAAPILIDPAVCRMFVQTKRKDAIDEVYSIVPNAYRIKTMPFELPEWQRTGEDLWRRNGDEGHVEIFRRKGDDGETEFWVQSFDSDGNAAGVRETAGAFPSFEFAVREGDSMLQVVSSPAP
jgi:hypothetical protein